LDEIGLQEGKKNKREIPMVNRGETGLKVKKNWPERNRESYPKDLKGEEFEGVTGLKVKL